MRQFEREGEPSGGGTALVDRVMVVDGETFSVHVRADGTHDFGWLSGPNPGYGFSSGYPAACAPTDEVIEHDLRTFLAMIDPNTGYVAD